jgi:hypothetical protein
VAACGSSSTGDDDDGIDASVAPPLTADEATTACVIYGSCMGDGINDCYTDAMPLWSPSEAHCVLAAGGDCTAVRACFGMTAVADPSCTSKTITCDGTNLVECVDGVRATYSCPNASLLLGVGIGPTCIATATGALCGTATCSTASSTCNGSVLSSCVASKGVLMSLDCAAYGQTCTSGVCTAAGGGGACATGTPTTCAGAEIVRCSGGVEIRTDCGAIGVDATCYAGSGQTPEPYCGFGSACYPTKGAETCSGSSVVFCGAGVMATVDCTSLGFTGCAAGHCYKI